MPRYRLDASIAVNDVTGRTIDVSANGILFESEQQLAAGDRVSLVFPLEHSGACVTCNGEVVRVQPRGDFYGIAVTYEPIEFNLPT
jgi:PilZ domain